MEARTLPLMLSRKWKTAMDQACTSHKMMGMDPPSCLCAGRQAFTAVKEGLSVIFLILILKMGFCGLPFQINRVMANQ
jgi:Na+(H+)/acetate symporter ActP